MTPTDLDWFSTSEATRFNGEGWILPCGKFLAAFRCDEGPDHATVAKWYLGEDGEAEADRLGWFRVSDYRDRICASELSWGQLNTYFDLCEALNWDYKLALGEIKFLGRANQLKEIK